MASSEPAALASEPITLDADSAAPGPSAPIPRQGAQDAEAGTPSELEADRAQQARSRLLSPCFSDLEARGKAWYWNLD